MLWKIQRFYLRTSEPLRLHDIEARSPLYTQFNETVEGIITIRALGWHPCMRQETKRMLDISQRPLYLLISIQQWLTLVLNLLVAGLAMLIVGLIIPLRNVLEPAYLGFALSNIMTLGENLRNLIVWWMKLETAIGAVKRIQTFSSETACEACTVKEQLLSDFRPSHGEVRFISFTASYEDWSSPAHLALRRTHWHLRPKRERQVYAIECIIPSRRRPEWDHHHW